MIPSSNRKQRGTLNVSSSAVPLAGACLLCIEYHTRSLQDAKFFAYRFCAVLKHVCVNFTVVLCVQVTDDSWLNASDIEVAVSDGDVTLTGSVRSREDKKRAEALAESVTGVDNVQNNLRIDRGTGTTATTVPLSDPL